LPYLYKKRKYKIYYIIKSIICNLSWSKAKNNNNTDLIIAINNSNNKNRNFDVIIDNNNKFININNNNNNNTRFTPSKINDISLYETNLLENDSLFHVVINLMEYDEDFKLENINNGLLI